VTAVNLSSRARRDLRRLDPPIRRRIAEALQQSGEEPPPDNLDIKRIVGAPAATYRVRVGDWRVLYEHDEAGVLIIRVVARQDLDDAVRRL
jgi:mRNA interferase RelE/StbE